MIGVNLSGVQPPPIYSHSHRHRPTWKRMCKNINTSHTNVKRNTKQLQHDWSPIQIQ